GPVFCRSGGCRASRSTYAVCLYQERRGSMPRLDRLSQIARNNLLTFPAQVNETAPFLRPAKPLAAGRLAIVTTAGLHRRGDRLFTPGDQSYRVSASHTPTVDIIHSHTT